jgi:signal-transduction protein with cAMP-binding, CBS, and nucleotidyltransferase domain
LCGPRLGACGYAKTGRCPYSPRSPSSSAARRGQLAKIASIVREVQYPAATPVGQQGKPGSDFFVVVDGEADVRRGARKLATLRAGSFFGEIALVTGSRRTATVTTGIPMRALVITRHDFRKLLQDSPDLQMKSSKRSAAGSRSSHPTSRNKESACATSRTANCPPPRPLCPWSETPGWRRSWSQVVERRTSSEQLTTRLTAP